ncbi:MAG: alpha/beta fold hydrolase [Candidatus Poribacteria bacterium]|nr:alpha/beta fold hydrolase [Candidatus Poribacteria bacterium]
MNLRRAAGPFLTSMFAAFVVLSSQTAFAQPAETLTPYTDAQFELMSDYMSYDATIPLNAAVVDQAEFETQTRYKIAFRGSRDEMIPGYLSIPKEGKGPFPCVLLMHGLGASKSAWWEDEGFSKGPQLTGKLIAMGYAVFALDAKYHGERAHLNNYEQQWTMLQRGWNTRLRQMMIESTVDYRRALDVLETREDIDAKRIGAIGYSMGGMMLHYLTALEPRIDAAVSCVSPLSGGLSFAPNRVTPFIRAPFAYLMGSQDMFYTAAQVETALEWIPGEAKMSKFYESGHSLPIEYIEDATAWIETHLK